MDSYDESEKIETGEKVILIGDAAVGKTSILHRYIQGNFSENQKPTIGCDHFEKTVELSAEKHVSLSIWDTAGQERFRGLASAYYKKAKCVVLVFDFTKKSSFEKLEYWKDEINNFAEVNTAVVLVGNKFDLKDKFQVTEDDMKAYADKYKYDCYATSALENTNIEDLFKKVAEMVDTSNNNNGSEITINKKNINKKEGSQVSLDADGNKKEDGCGC